MRVKLDSTMYNMHGRVSNWVRSHSHALLAYLSRKMYLQVVEDESLMPLVPIPNATRLEIFFVSVMLTLYMVLDWFL